MTSILPPSPSRRILHDIPWDIWLYLAQSLELSDRVSLALTCKTLKSLLGKSLSQLNTQPRQRLSFLRRLDSTLPDHRLCSACLKFHLRKPDEERDWLRMQPRTACGERHIPLLKGLYLNWPSIQLALRARHYQSEIYGHSLEEMPKVLEATRDDNEDLWWKHSIYPWFSEDRLMLGVNSFRVFDGDSQTLSQFARGYFIDVIPHKHQAYLHVGRYIDVAAEDAWSTPVVPGWCPSPDDSHSWYYWSTGRWEPDAGLPGLHWTELSRERRAFGIPEWSNWRFDNKTGLPIKPLKAIDPQFDGFASSPPSTKLPHLTDGSCNTLPPPPPSIIEIVVP